MLDCVISLYKLYNNSIKCWCVKIYAYKMHADNVSE